MEERKRNAATGKYQGNATAATETSDVVTDQMNLAVGSLSRSMVIIKTGHFPPLYFYMYDGANARGNDNALKSAFNEQGLSHIIGKECHALTCKDWTY